MQIIMRRLANCFLILFLVAAFSRFIYAAARLYPALDIPAFPAQAIGLLCFLCAGLLFPGFAFNRNLPLPVLLPPQLWLLWSLVDFWPLENWFGAKYQLLAAVAQLLLGLICLNLNRTLNGRSLLLTAGQFAGPAFSLRRFVLFCLAAPLVFPLLAAIIGFSLLGNLIESGSAGFVHLKPNGLYLEERTYVQAGKQIRLAGMIHLAQPEYYSALTASIPPERTLILLEGVTDRDGRLKEHFSYRRIADLLGLTAQEHNVFQGRLISPAQLHERATGPPPAVDLLPADIDLREFDPLTIEVLNALAKYVLNNESPLAGYLEFSRWAQQNTPADINRIIMRDLLDKRNQHVLGYLPEALNKYDHLVIPWGALHMKGIERSLFKRDFALADRRGHLSIDFRQLPYAKLWKALTEKSLKQESILPR